MSKKKPKKKFIKKFILKLIHKEKFYSVFEIEQFFNIPINENRLKEYCKLNKIDLTYTPDKDGSLICKYSSKIWKAVYNINTKQIT